MAWRILTKNFVFPLREMCICADVNIFINGKISLARKKVLVANIKILSELLSRRTKKTKVILLTQTVTAQIPQKVGLMIPVCFQLSRRVCTVENFGVI
jgi:hypothetical protein